MPPTLLSGSRVTVSLTESFAYCRDVTRRARSSFSLAFRLLPAEKRAAMHALYAFLRITDDLADEPGDPEVKRRSLDDWRARLDDALRGDPSHPLHPALCRTIEAFDIPPPVLHQSIDGALTDLEPVAFATFDELYPYCRSVASSVGEACVRIWGCRGDATAATQAAGVAFQLTNILRDLGEDLRLGRVYLPQDELARFDCEPKRWNDPAHREQFRELMRFQVTRARQFYAKARPLADLLTNDGRAVFRTMAGLYEQLLTEIERRDYDVFTERVRLNRPTKLRFFAAAWPIKWGWTR